MGYMLAMGRCYSCGQLFSFAPDLVPSIRDRDGVKQPICRACIEYANPERIKRGLAPIEILPGAYEPEEEGGY